MHPSSLSKVESNELSICLIQPRWMVSTNLWCKSLLILDLVTALEKARFEKIINRTTSKKGTTFNFETRKNPNCRLMMYCIIMVAYLRFFDMMPLHAG